MTIDLNRPVPVLPLCSNGHVACVEARWVAEDEEHTYCWGWHLTLYDDEWPALIAAETQVSWCVDRLLADLVVEGIDLRVVTFNGRGFPGWLTEKVVDRNDPS